MSRVHILLLILSTLFACESRKNERPNPDVYLSLSPEERLLPENATASFVMHEGLDVALFAAEPMVVNPTNIDVDAKGRVWVCESYNYAVPEAEQQERGGRITILEDTDGDGRADTRKVFYQGEDIRIPLGIAVLGNKVYVSHSPYMFVFTDEDGDDKPDKKEKLFTGMGNPGDHSTHAVVFGPDGKLYFNMGNGAGPVMDSLGNILIDKVGNEVRPYGRDYIGGIILRCNPDGSDLEVLGHNFRNNYEVAVDSYGNIWQSDNDDDGNASCRINFIIEYGNYGYLDEMNRRHWSAYRTNMEAEIPQRHWHQNDPGVIPNLLITGPGSPAGIAVYEGDLLPDVFRGQMIHADAGPNVIRSYPVKKHGAGYAGEIVELLKSVHDQWFRPVDVCVAPDGSLFVADWYDPGVGGGAAADAGRGRIFRIAPDVSRYRVKYKEIESVTDGVEALKSPNAATRYLAWTYLHEQGKDAEAALLELVEGDNPLYKARALWLGGRIPGEGKLFISRALGDENPDIRIVGIRMARQSGDFVPAVRHLAHDPAPEVRREIAVGLHTVATPEAAELWAQLALQYDGEDRWYLEALGVGAARNWDACFAAWMRLREGRGYDKAARDIVWRSRSALALPVLAELIQDSATKQEELPRYFRAFDFHGDASRHKVLLGLLKGNHPAQETISASALNHIDPEVTGTTPELRAAVNARLDAVRGTEEFVTLVERYRVTSRREELLVMAAGEDRSVASSAARLLLSGDGFGGVDLVRARLKAGNAEAEALMEALAPLGSRQAVALLSEVVLDGKQSLAMRRAAVLALGKSWPGESGLLECVKDAAFDDALAVTAAGVLFNAYRIDIQRGAEQYLARPATAEGAALPPVRDLAVRIGDAQKGAQVFTKYCQTCHVVGGNGTDFGPALSAIGNKLSKEGLYRAIIYPDEGINNGYEGYALRLKDGTVVTGIIESTSATETALRIPGGTAVRYPAADIISQEPLTQSLMPNLSGTMSVKELTDLVEYLGRLGTTDHSASRSVN
ncbi:MAG: c-type cytochrome [Cyclobacteriaceae bacterium]|nr:c-type cytochrome [Cyclobacteriaceae bacterium]